MCFPVPLVLNIIISLRKSNENTHCPLLLLLFLYFST
uniref:Uncharacterized protein n=1 Tax=Anguilla anguilla TaxID=7936 RepID=A0A0E9RAY1_ANGAN